MEQPVWVCLSHIISLLVLFMRSVTQFSKQIAGCRILKWPWACLHWFFILREDAKRKETLCCIILPLHQDIFIITLRFSSSFHSITHKIRPVARCNEKKNRFISTCYNKLKRKLKHLLDPLLPEDYLSCILMAQYPLLLPNCWLFSHMIEWQKHTVKMTYTTL